MRDPRLVKLAQLVLLVQVRSAQQAAACGLSTSCGLSATCALSMEPLVCSWVWKEDIHPRKMIPLLCSRRRARTSFTTQESRRGGGGSALRMLGRAGDDVEVPDWSGRAKLWYLNDPNILSRA